MLPKQRKKELENKLEKLRNTDKWKFYYEKIILSSDLEKSPFKNEEEAKRYIDKLVLMKVDNKDPFSSFDDFWRNRKK